MAATSVGMCSRLTRLGATYLRLPPKGRIALVYQQQHRWPSRTGYFSSVAGMEKSASATGNAAMEGKDKKIEPDMEVSESASGTPAESEDVRRLMSDVEKLNVEIEALTEKVQETDDKYKRSLAENENMRKRLTKQIEDVRMFGIQGFCKDLLEVADVLGKAMESVPPDQITDDNPHLKNLFEGLKMTETHLHQVFDRHHLTNINPLGEKFDPNQHEALFQQCVEGKKPGTVTVVSKLGYKLHDRTIRPALVGVAKESPSAT